MLFEFIDKSYKFIFVCYIPLQFIFIFYFFLVQSEDDYFAFQKPAKLVCNFTGDTSNISWKKGNQTVSQINTGSGNANSQIIEHPNGTLEFINPSKLKLCCFIALV